MPWTDAYRVNVSILDQQHQDLFDAVNQLEQASRAGEGNASIDACIRQCSGEAVVVSASLAQTGFAEHR